MINNLLPILSEQLDVSNSIKYNEIEQVSEKPIEYPIIHNLSPISIQKTDDLKITDCDLSLKKVISHKEVNTQIKHLKKTTLTNDAKKLYYTTLLVSAMVSKDIKIDKNNIENIKIYDDPIIYLKDKQFIFKGTKPVGIILDCDTAYMLKDIIEELNNHSIDTSLKDVFIESLK
jgi:hypothetical protein